MSEDNFSTSKLKCTEKWAKNNRTVTRKQNIECTIDQDVPPNDDTSSSMIIIEDLFDAETDSGDLSPDLENNEAEQPEAKNLKKKRKWVRRNACIFCESLVTNYTRHLRKNHANESEVLHYISINDPDPKERQRRRREITDDLRNKGNFLHNSKVFFGKEGDLIPNKGKCSMSSPSTFTTCKNCLGTFKRKYFYKHFKSCGSKLLNNETLSDSHKKRVLANHSISIIPHLSAASQEVKNHILPRLRNDEITTLVKMDPLIMAYGSRLMKKKKEARSRKAICSKLRDLANLLRYLKSEDPSIKELSHLFKPQHYSTFVNCVNKMCGFDEETGFVKTISIPSRLRPSILGCIEVLYIEMKMGNDSRAYKDTLKKQLDEFKLLIQINWEWEISSNAEKTRKRNLITKETVMPLEQTKKQKSTDVMIISQEGQLLQEKEENENRLQNRQSGAEMQGKNYLEDKDETVKNAKIRIEEQNHSENLVEKKLSKLRQKNKENEKNFENSHAGEDVQEKNYFKDTDETVEKLKSRIQERHPSENIVEDKLCELRQKKMSDTAQDFSELHDRNGVSQANRIVRNVKGQFQGDSHKSKINKLKQEIYSKKSPLQNAESKDDEENQIITIVNLNSKSGDVTSESSDEKSINSKIDEHKGYKIIRKRRAQKHSEESLSSSDELLSVLETRRRKKTHTRWTTEELKALRTYFKDYIKNKTNPGKAKCLEVLKEAPVLSRRTWMQINTQVNNIYMKKI